MLRLLISAMLFSLPAFTIAQSIKINYISKVPVKMQQCGAQYTYDTSSLKKKQYIMLADFQNLGMISINGKLISLQLKDSKLSDTKMNIATYTGGGYIVITTLKTIRQTKQADYEEGLLEVSKGKEKISIRIHGQSACDESKAEGNGP